MNIVKVEADKLFAVTSAKLEQVDVLLDIGSGIRPQQLLRPMTHICCEPCLQYVEKLKVITEGSSDRSYVIIHADWRTITGLLPTASVDTVILADVIEHLEKHEAYELLQDTIRLARRQVAVFTPLGFMPQFHRDGKDAWGLDGGEWQEHKSGWMPEDFGEGWDVVFAEEFHTTDNWGEPLHKPYGAMWAVLTRQENSTAAKTPERACIIDVYNLLLTIGTHEELRRVFKIMNLLISVFSPFVGKWALRILELGARLKANRYYIGLYRLLSGREVRQKI